jgi:hypothetical protein
MEPVTARTTATLKALQDAWEARGVVNPTPATEAEIAAFEAGYNVRLPAEVRAYFRLLNGTRHGKGGLDDSEHLLSFWHLSQVRTLAEEGITDDPRADQIFVFADYSLWVWAFGLRLGLDPSQPAPIIVDIGWPHQEVSPDLNSFLEAYLRSDTDVLYPETRPRRPHAV